jgi:hypothetical protein
MVHAVPGDRDNCACFCVNLKAFCLLRLLETRPQHGSHGLGLLLDRRVRHLWVGSGFVPGQQGGDPVPPPTEALRSFTGYHLRGL